MIKIVLFFLIIFGIFFFGIKSFREMSGKDQWALTKYIGYSIICAILTLAFLIAIVILF